MKRKIVTLLALLCLGLVANEDTRLHAQQQSQAQQQPAVEPEEEFKPAEIETPADAPEDTDLILADIDEDAAQDEDALRNGRFIPTEEISQDLGVSFPIDI